MRAIGSAQKEGETAYQHRTLPPNVPAQLAKNMEGGCLYYLAIFCHASNDMV